MKHLNLAAETYAFIVLSLADLLLTVWLIHTGRASEGNPIMDFYLEQGLGTMVLAKVTLVACGLFVAEWARRYRPVFVRRAMRLVLAAYLILLGATLFLNCVAAPCPPNPEAAVPDSASVTSFPTNIDCWRGVSRAIPTIRHACAW